MEERKERSPNVAEGERWNRSVALAGVGRGQIKGECSRMKTQTKQTMKKPVWILE